MGATGTQPVFDTITEAAEKFAKANGLYESLLHAKQIVRKMIPAIRALAVDVEEDPEEGGYTTICFQIETRQPVDRVLESDNALEDALIQEIPAKDRFFFSLKYRFVT